MPRFDGSSRLTAPTLDRLTHRCKIIETKGESYRLHDAMARTRRSRSTQSAKHIDTTNPTEKLCREALPFSTIACSRIRSAFTRPGECTNSSWREPLGIASKSLTPGQTALQ